MCSSFYPYLLSFMTYCEEIKEDRNMQFSLFNLEFFLVFYLNI